MCVPKHLLKTAARVVGPALLLMPAGSDASAVTFVRSLGTAGNETCGTSISITPLAGSVPAGRAEDTR